jgi:hypothetical protein
MNRRHTKTEVKDSDDDLLAFDFIVYQKDRLINPIGVLRCEARAPRTEKQQQHN